jgi:hypothetical protein
VSAAEAEFLERRLPEMNPSKYERSIFQLLLSATTFPNSSKIPPISVPDLVSMIRDSYNANMAIAYINGEGRLVGDAGAAGADERNALYIADWHEDDGGEYDVLLLHRGDPDEVNPSFVRSKDRSSSTVPASPDEAPGRSAHLMIAKSPSKGGQYRALLEYAPGVSRGLVMSLFHILLDEITEHDPNFTYQKKIKAGEYKTIRWRPRFSFQSTLSASLKEDLKDGTVTGIDLIKRQPKIQGLDFEKKIVQKSVRLELQVSEGTPVETVAKAIGLYSKRDDFDEMQVHIRELKGKSASPRRALQEFQSRELLYSRKITIDGFDEPLEDACYDAINDVIVPKMAGVLRTGRW